jgi:hypothetical protein
MYCVGLIVRVQLFQTTQKFNKEIVGVVTPAGAFQYFEGQGSGFVRGLCKFQSL